MEKEKAKTILQALESPIEFPEKEKKLESNFKNDIQINDIQTNVDTEDTTEISQDQITKKFTIVFILMILIIIGGMLNLFFNLVLFIMVIVILSKT